MLEKAMHLAIQSAIEGINNNDGGPFGAAIVRDNQIIAVAHNTVLKDNDPTCHAEINAIRLACQHLKRHELSDCQIVTTMEPCPMCLTAIYWARIQKIYIGAQRQVAQKYGFDDVHFYEEIARPLEQRKVICETLTLGTQVEEVFKEWQALNRDLY